MNTISTITWLTFQEARRRRVALAALALGLIFVVLYAIGFSYIAAEVRNDTEVNAPAVQRQIFSLITIAGLYVIHFLTIMLAIFGSVDTVAGEITSHTVQAMVTKPVRRWHVLVGKWLGYGLMIIAYLALLTGGVMLSTFLISGYVPPNPVAGVALIMLEALVLLALSLLGGTRLSTLTNGVLLFMLYGFAFIGAWVEQIGALLQSESAIRVGIISSLILPVEALWRRAAYLMQPTISNVIPTPFSSASVPSEAMVAYAIGYGVIMLLLAMRVFGRRDL